jgi:glycosyltransferase involved in cell wall biosynthesis
LVSTGAPRHDVAIYAPAAACLYERRPHVTGGAERQTTLLAAGLTQAGLRVAHVVLPVEEPDPGLPPNLTLVQRRLVTTGRGPAARAAQLRQVWSALAEADAAVYVFRSGLPTLGITELFCRLHGRRLVFAVSNDLDLTLDFFENRRPERELYKFGVRGADAVVVQSHRQAGLARRMFPRLPRVVELPSFAASAPLSTAVPEAFLWVGRLDKHKQPLRYVELAAALPEAQFWMVARQLDPERSGGSPGGGADPGLEQEIRARAASLPNLTMLEQRPHAQAMELVERSVAVVNTGRAEGMPNLFLEAWARGIPVLTFEFDPDGQVARGALGESAEGSVERFREGAWRLWQTRGDRADLATRVRAHVESTHGVHAVTARWLELIADVRSEAPVSPSAPDRRSRRSS